MPCGDKANVFREPVKTRTALLYLGNFYGKYVKDQVLVFFPVKDKE